MILLIRKLLNLRFYHQEKGEYRLTLRQDNVFRLIDKAKEIGLIPKEEILNLKNDIKEINEEIKKIMNVKCISCKEEFKLKKLI